MARLREYVRNTLREILEEEEELEETSTTAATPGYNIPAAFQGNSEHNRRRRKKQAETSGMKVVGPMDESFQPLLTVKEIGQSVRSISSQLEALNHLLRRANHMKKENKLNSQDLWKRTSKHLTKIENKLLSMAHQIRELKY